MHVLQIVFQDAVSVKIFLAKIFYQPSTKSDFYTYEISFSICMRHLLKSMLITTPDDISALGYSYQYCYLQNEVDIVTEVKRKQRKRRACKMRERIVYIRAFITGDA